jgi:hypothetical protein
VPNAAVLTVGPRSTVTVLRNGLPVVVPVTTGLVGDSRTEITSGLVEGDVIQLSVGAPSAGGLTFPGGGIGGAARAGGLGGGARAGGR